MNDDIDFSLSAANPFGKCSEEVKTRIPEEADAALTMLASAYRMTKSEYVRNLIMEHVFGKAEMVRRRIDPPIKG